MSTITMIGQDCVGCRSCEQSCPPNCITIEENAEGFLYPVVNDSMCVQCGICLKKCPVSQTWSDVRDPLAAYALKELDTDRIFCSSSGGASDAAVGAVLSRGGVVYGAAYNEDLAVQHIEITNEEGRKKLQSSKYVQSDMKDAFSKAKERLQEGKIVLFTGTPCQIAGLYAFLGKNHKNLYTIDLICHGVPSPKFLKKYFEYQERQLGERIESFNFRAKDKRGWGTQYMLKTKTKTKTRTKTLVLDKYGKYFMDGDCYRESCYRCRYANMNRPGDLTVGDFWGIDRCKPDFSSPLGVSSVIVNSDKGYELIDWMKLDSDIISVAVADVLVKQHNLIQPTARRSIRDKIYKEIDEVHFIEKIQVGLNAKERIKSMVPKKIVTKLKRYLG
ncbi:Coenzyme F420 hydrogenase/dehydrogenase, beta subunit C-terminal domain [Clostridium boliviensis]|uniref:Coenzyme F420 hydrogenase/dehydrogenase, beta subunit C-terminal domain n=1 Tax=Clostridium boliviensis TaxID=318465 RepID=A0ABU4GS51_9CLOT|nr:Coenzyme F420 hydrogenase/dehydrogenase, beta subunit C-terminal domain [Clostridium boliviensis]MDW2799768.1 Coenzyme F420 hydrogenase/dehydrogenase, beta subunit C-terminal domain [Clostridium boliviensis]